MALQDIPVELVELVQSRVQLDMLVIQEYAEEMNSGADFPPVRIVADGDGKLWCWDGCHRTLAARQAGQTYIRSEVVGGTRRDALLLAAGANSTHGLRRSNDDKRRAIQFLLDDPEWAQWSDHEIARRCAVSHTFVAKMRPVVTGNVASERTYTTRHGTVATMDTSQIGRGASTPEPVEQLEMNEELDITDDDYEIEDEPPAPRPTPVMTPAAPTAPRPAPVMTPAAPTAPRPAPVMTPLTATTVAPTEVISIRILPGDVVAERRVMLAAGVEGRAPSVMRAGALRELPDMVGALVNEFINLAAADEVLAEMEIEEG